MRCRRSTDATVGRGAVSWYQYESADMKYVQSDAACGPDTCAGGPSLHSGAKIRTSGGQISPKSAAGRPIAGVAKICYCLTLVKTATWHFLAALVRFITKWGTSVAGRHTVGGGSSDGGFESCHQKFELRRHLELCLGLQVHHVVGVTGLPRLGQTRCQLCAWRVLMEPQISLVTLFGVRVCFEHQKHTSRFS